MEELVKRLRELASIPEHCENVADCDKCPKEDICLSFTNKRIIEVATQAADAIEELNKPKWIPVTERLPEYGDWVLGIGAKKGYYVCEYRGITHFPYSGDSPWFSAKGRAVTVTHWMPLPQAPKEE